MTRVFRGRQIRSDYIAAAQALVSECFGAGRSRIGSELAQYWHWRSDSGPLKVRGALPVLVALESRGYLQLPPPLIVHGPVREPGQPGQPKAPATRSVGSLSELLPLSCQLVHSAEQRRQWRRVLAEHHYLRVPRLVGDHLS